jgi:hypothetical protein
LKTVLKEWRLNMASKTARRIRETFHVNIVDVEGIVTKVWARGLDIYARLAIYDRESEILEPGENGRLPRRKAHYVTVIFKEGKTDDGHEVSLATKDRIRVGGYLRDSSYSESLETFLRKAKKFNRIEDRDDEARVGRVATYVVGRSLVRFSR